jgi:hypothetical protein
MIQTPVLCPVHGVVAMTSHFLIVYECIAGGAGVFMYRDSNCIVTVLIHSRHVEMAAGIHEGCSVAGWQRETAHYLVSCW